MNRFFHVTDWLLDLDNTLYAAAMDVMPEMDERMTDYVMRQQGISKSEALDLRARWCRDYGTTLAGLMTELKLDPTEYIEYVHDIDFSPIRPCVVTQEKLRQLPGRRFVFTNGARAYALRMLAHLGLENHVEGVFAIEDSGYTPKPQKPPYEKFLDRFGLDPRTCCMVEDIEKNLEVPAALGMTTLWIHGDQPQPAVDNHIHHRAKTLAQWLGEDLSWSAVKP